MVWLNNIHKNELVAKGTFGGSRCICIKCANERSRLEEIDILGILYEAQNGERKELFDFDKEINKIFPENGEEPRTIDGHVVYVKKDKDAIHMPFK